MLLEALNAFLNFCFPFRTTSSPNPNSIHVNPKNLIKLNALSPIPTETAETALEESGFTQSLLQDHSHSVHPTSTNLSKLSNFGACEETGPWSQSELLARGN